MASDKATKNLLLGVMDPPEQHTGETLDMTQMLVGMDSKIQFTMLCLGKVAIYLCKERSFHDWNYLKSQAPVQKTGQLLDSPCIMTLSLNCNHQVRKACDSYMTDSLSLPVVAKYLDAGSTLLRHQKMHQIAMAMALMSAPQSLAEP